MRWKYLRHASEYLRQIGENGEDTYGAGGAAAGWGIGHRGRAAKSSAKALAHYCEVDAG